MNNPPQGSVSDSEPVSIPTSLSHQSGPIRPSASILEPYRGIPDPSEHARLNARLMPMDEIMNLYTGWIDINGSIQVKDIVPAIQYEMSIMKDMYFILKESMYRWGQWPPIHITRPYAADGTMMLASPIPIGARFLKDGIHRIATAIDLGWDSMLVSTDRIKWQEWDESPSGEKYHAMWRKRLGNII